ncbi:hypothetical protein [Burkholderia glumae]|uniref:Uncharacterized protein n=1 Tax=Burkholderia glumae TaxID=337 RepID=A0ABY5BCJ3_BURGL|nr:hypothetical protein [Burkholderia glumae]QJW82108.1 hypothetical protein GAS18_26540 [Burkholderia glumae]USS43784.1 hypothetical protein NFI99_04890 [Burkholderia glumae]
MQIFELVKQKFDSLLQLHHESRFIHSGSMSAAGRRGRSRAAIPARAAALAAAP